MAAPTAASAACFGSEEHPVPLDPEATRQVCSARVALFEKRHEALYEQAFIEGPTAGAYGVSQPAAEAVGTLAKGTTAALLDALFDDRPVLLQQLKDAGLPEVCAAGQRGSFNPLCCVCSLCLQARVACHVREGCPGRAV